MSSDKKRALVIGGSAGAGKRVAEMLAARGQQVILTSRDNVRAEAVAAGLRGEGHQGLSLDLTEPEAIAGVLAKVGPIDHLVLSAVERDRNSVRNYDIAAAKRAVGLKLVGYTAVAAALVDRFTATASIAVIGGLAVERPYPGSTSISIVNGGVRGLVRTLATELAPIRVNGVHPGPLADTDTVMKASAEFTRSVLQRTPEGRLVETVDVARTVLFLLDSPGVNGIDFIVDGGLHLR